MSAWTHSPDQEFCCWASLQRRSSHFSHWNDWGQSHTELIFNGYFNVLVTLTLNQPDFKGFILLCYFFFPHPNLTRVLVLFFFFMFPAWLKMWTADGAHPCHHEAPVHLQMVKPAGAAAVLLSTGAGIRWRRGKDLHLLCCDEQKGTGIISPLQTVSHAEWRQISVVKISAYYDNNVQLSGS